MWWSFWTELVAGPASITRQWLHLYLMVSSFHTPKDTVKKTLWGYWAKIMRENQEISHSRKSSKTLFFNLGFKITRASAA